MNYCIGIVNLIPYEKRKTEFQKIKKTKHLCKAPPQNSLTKCVVKPCPELGNSTTWEEWKPRIPVLGKVGEWPRECPSLPWTRLVVYMEQEMNALHASSHPGDMWCWRSCASPLPSARTHEGLWGMLGEAGISRKAQIAPSDTRTLPHVPDLASPFLHCVWTSFLHSCLHSFHITHPDGVLGPRLWLGTAFVLVGVWRISHQIQGQFLVSLCLFTS